MSEFIKNVASEKNGAISRQQDTQRQIVCKTLSSWAFAISSRNDWSSAVESTNKSTMSWGAPPKPPCWSDWWRDSWTQHPYGWASGFAFLLWLFIPWEGTRGISAMNGFTFWQFSNTKFDFFFGWCFGFCFCFVFKIPLDVCCSPFSSSLS